MQFSSMRTRVEVDLGRIKENYRRVMAMLASNANAIAVVKANAYGHGAVAVARCLCDAGAKVLSVANIDEARELRHAGIDCDIMILGYTPPPLARELCELSLTQAILSIEYAKALSAVGGKGVRAEIAVDTGMRRIGLDARDTDSCVREIARICEMLDVRGIFTHLCAADGESAEDRAFTSTQLGQFKAVTDATSDLGIGRAHALNSAGILYHSSDASSEMLGTVRPGIILYGLCPRIGAALPEGIFPALSWYTTVAMVKRIRRGDSVGYGRMFVADRDMTLATLPVGYADGYPRSISGRGRVVIRGSYAPIIGRICMNQMMVDVSGIDEVSMGDLVTLVGGSGINSISIDELARISGSINYEIAARIADGIPRLYRG